MGTVVSAERAEYIRDWKQRNGARVKETHRRWELQRRYGLTLEEYDDMLEGQKGGCALCGHPPQAQRLHVDHDHATNRVRGILCLACNAALGKLGDSEEGLLRALAYIRGELPLAS